MFARQRRPVGALARALDVAKEVDAPCLRRRSVTQRAERNPELGHPARGHDGGAHIPAAVPAVFFLALIAHLRVVLHAGGVGPEDESILLVAERIEDHQERVRLVQLGVAPGVRRDNQRRIAVVQHDAHVNRLVVIEDADLGVLGGRLSFEGFGLDETREWRGVLPHALVEGTVDRWRFRDPAGGGDRLRCEGTDCRLVARTAPTPLARASTRERSRQRNSGRATAFVILRRIRRRARRCVTPVAGNADVTGSRVSHAAGHACAQFPGVLDGGAACSIVEHTPYLPGARDAADGHRKRCDVVLVIPRPVRPR